MNDKANEIIAAAREFLRGGDHEGACFVGPMGECELHWDLESERRRRLEKAVAAFDEGGQAA
jgi:hypothetical protein